MRAVVTVLIGENSFEIDRALKKVVASFDGRAEKIDGSELELRHLPDLLMGGTLFSEKRLIIIKNLSENKNVWNSFSDWLLRISDDTQIVLVELKPDKRTKAYKELQKNATVQEFKLWSERDTVQVEKWVMIEAKAERIELDKKCIQLLVKRVGVDQWALYYALQKLAVMGEVTPMIIENLIEANPTENIFNLFEAALKGDAIKVKHMLATLEIADDPYRLFGLLSGQVFQLAALSLTEKTQIEVAKDIGAHPFALSKLASYANKFDRPIIRKIVMSFSEADEAMKSSALDPWLLIERALVKVASDM